MTRQHREQEMVILAITRGANSIEAVSSATGLQPELIASIVEGMMRRSGWPPRSWDAGTKE